MFVVLPSAMQLPLLIPSEGLSCHLHAHIIMYLVYNSNSSQLYVIQNFVIINFSNIPDRRELPFVLTILGYELWGQYQNN